MLSRIFVLGVTIGAAVASISACAGSARPVAPPAPAPRENPGAATLTSDQLEEIQNVVQRGIDHSLRNCYQHELEESGKRFSAKLVLRILVGTRTRAVEVRMAESTLPSDRMKACVVATVRTWEFPKIKAPSWFTYPVSFDPAY